MAKETEQFDSFVEDFLGEKLERPLLIVGASKIEDLLYLILSKYLLTPLKKEDDLLQGDNPLSTFSSRIKICHRLGLIDAGLFGALDIIRKVRNSCAHSISFDIKSSPIREHILELRRRITPRASFQLTKKRYFNDIFEFNLAELQCILVTICVILEAINDSIEKTNGLINALQISNK